MKCVAAFKLCKDPKEAVVLSDGGIDWGLTKLAPSDSDDRAIEVGRELEGEIVGLTIGDGDVAWAAARGAVKTLHIKDADESLDMGRTADLLAAAVQKEEGTQLVLIGDSAWAPALPALLGAKLGWTCLTGVVEARKEGDGLVVKRRTQSMEQDIRLSLPAVLGIQALRESEDKPGMKQILAARKKPVEILAIQELGFDHPDAVAAVGTALPDSTAAKIINGEDAADIAKKLFETLKTEGVL